MRRARALAFACVAVLLWWRVRFARVAGAAMLAEGGYHGGEYVRAREKPEVRVPREDGTRKEETDAKEESADAAAEWKEAKARLMADDLMKVQAMVVKDERADESCRSRTKSRSDRSFLMCVGSILSATKVLTSASCVHEATVVRHNVKEPLAVILGVLSKTRQQVIRVRGYVIHPKHNNDPGADDFATHNLAILTLACRISPENYRRIELPTRPLYRECDESECRVLLVRKVGATDLVFQPSEAKYLSSERRRRRATNETTNDSVFSANASSRNATVCCRIKRSLTYVDSPISRGSADDDDEGETEKGCGEKSSSFVETVVKSVEKRANAVRSRDARKSVDSDDGEITVGGERKGEPRNNFQDRAGEPIDGALSKEIERVLREPIAGDARRSLSTRSSDGTRGCPQTGSAVLTGKVQPGLVAQSCDDRRPDTPWLYTDLYENLNWIRGLDENPNNSNVDAIVLRGNESCSTCVYNIFVNFIQNAVVNTGTMGSPVINCGSGMLCEEDAQLVPTTESPTNFTAELTTESTTVPTTESTTTTTIVPLKLPPEEDYPDAWPSKSPCLVARPLSGVLVFPCCVYPYRICANDETAKTRESDEASFGNERRVALTDLAGDNSESIPTRDNNKAPAYLIDDSIAGGWRYSNAHRDVERKTNVKVKEPDPVSPANADDRAYRSARRKTGKKIELPNRVDASHGIAIDSPMSVGDYLDRSYRPRSGTRTKPDGFSLRDRNDFFGKYERAKSRTSTAAVPMTRTSKTGFEKIPRDDYFVSWNEKSVKSDNDFPREYGPTIDGGENRAAGPEYWEESDHRTFDVDDSSRFSRADRNA